VNVVIILTFRNSTSVKVLSTSRIVKTKIETKQNIFKEEEYSSYLQYNLIINSIYHLIE
jgi:hypothetical protein